MTTPRNPPVNRPRSAGRFHAADCPIRLGAASVVLVARRALVDYLRSGWILVELAYVLALYVFAFRYPFETPFFFETADGGLGFLAVCATLLLVTSATQPVIIYEAAAERVPRRAYAAGLVLATATLRISVYLPLLALVLLSHRLLNATAGAVLAGSAGLIVSCIVLAALALALSPAFAPRLARPIVSPDGRTFRSKSGQLITAPQRRHLIFIAWLTGALYSYTATGALAAIFFVWRLPLLPLFACYTMGMTGAIGWGGMLALIIDAGYVVGLVLLADFWRNLQEEAQTAASVEKAKGAAASHPEQAE